MKKFQFFAKIFVFAFLFFGAMSQTPAQTPKGKGPQKISATSKVAPTLSTTAKLYMVIAYLETKPDYKAGMSKDSFLNSMFKDFKAESAPALKKYFGEVFEYHKQNMHPDDVYQKADVKTFIAVSNDLIGLYRPKMSKSDFRKSIMGTEVIPVKPSFWNWIRKWHDFLTEVYQDEIYWP